MENTKRMSAAFRPLTFLTCQRESRHFISLKCYLLW